MSFHLSKQVYERFVVACIVSAAGEILIFFISHKIASFSMLKDIALLWHVLRFPN